MYDAAHSCSERSFYKSGSLLQSCYKPTDTVRTSHIFVGYHTPLFLMEKADYNTNNVDQGKKGKTSHGLNLSAISLSSINLTQNIMRLCLAIILQCVCLFCRIFDTIMNIYPCHYVFLH